MSSEYTGRRECHIETDWLLIYKIDGQCIVCMSSLNKLI
ncbi:type II toxin-antitoxin system mRNA interferase toxin, RelE/StbE family [Candidatus Magnetobacterium casense]|nr:type II toxin-antitoxin system mRNA interferase toxin, RelE/StbE family [Candidatus Magnetobacterium casensis]